MKSKKLKYLNIITEIDGKKFDSKKEAKRYCELKILSQAGLIKNLECQPKIDLLVNGKSVGKYVGDFRYINEQGITIIEDVKSKATKTPVYNLKKKILLTLKPPVQITEIL